MRIPRLANSPTPFSLNHGGSISNIEVLLNRLEPGRPPTVWPKEDSGAYIVTLDGNVIVNLQENVATHSVSFFSSPGYVANPGDFADAEGYATRFFVAAEEDLLQEVRVIADSGLTLIIQTCPYASLDNVRFKERLLGFLKWYRLWQQILCDESPLPNI